MNEQGVATVVLRSSSDFFWPPPATQRNRLLKKSFLNKAISNNLVDHAVAAAARCSAPP